MTFRDPDLKCGMHLKLHQRICTLTSTKLLKTQLFEIQESLDYPIKMGEFKVATSLRFHITDIVERYLLKYIL